MAVTGIFQKNAAIVPLVSSAQTEESYWLGAMLADLLLKHLKAGGIPIVDYNAAAKALISSKKSLPIDKDGAKELADGLNAQFLVYGVYIHDLGSSMLGVRLSFYPDSTQTQLETSSPLTSFSSFIPRLALSIIEKFGVAVSEEMRRKIQQHPRPEKFEAFQRVAKARLAWMRGEHELALTAVDSALSIDVNYEDAMFLEVMIARSADDVNTAMRAFKRWAQYAIRVGDNSEGAQRISRLGHWLLERGEWQGARTAYENAMALFSKSGDSIGELRMSNNLANLDLLQGKNLTVIRRYRRTLREFEVSPENAADRATTYLNLGLAYKNQGQTHESEQALAEAFSAVSPTGDQRLEAYVVAQQGALFADIDRWEDAQEAYSRALALFTRVGDHVGKAMIHTHQALLSRSQGDLIDAESLLKTAMTEIQEPANIHIQAIIFYNLADLYLAMDDYEKGLPFAEKAYTIFSKLDSAEQSLSSELLDKLRAKVDNGANNPIPVRNDTQSGDASESEE